MTPPEDVIVATILVLDFGIYVQREMKKGRLVEPAPLLLMNQGLLPTQRIVDQRR